jgi:probable rRNA maturation factor
MATVHLINGTRTRVDPGAVRRWVGAAARRLGVPKGAEVSVRFCGDALCRRYNREFFDRDRPTDVIAWPSGDRGYLGDVLVNLAQARRQARRLGVPFREEVHRLVVHGLLHLAGYDHAADRGEMEALQERLVRGR